MRRFSEAAFGWVWGKPCREAPASSGLAPEQHVVKKEFLPPKSEPEASPVRAFQSIGLHEDDVKVEDAVTPAREESPAEDAGTPAMQEGTVKEPASTPGKHQGAVKEYVVTPGRDNGAVKEYVATPASHRGTIKECIDSPGLHPVKQYGGTPCRHDEALHDGAVKEYAGTPCMHHDGLEHSANTPDGKESAVDEEDSAEDVKSETSQDRVSRWATTFQRWQQDESEEEEGAEFQDTWQALERELEEQSASEPETEQEDQEEEPALEDSEHQQDAPQLGEESEADSLDATCAEDVSEAESLPDAACVEYFETQKKESLEISPGRGESKERSEELESLTDHRQEAVHLEAEQPVLQGWASPEQVQKRSGLDSELQQEPQSQPELCQKLPQELQPSPQAPRLQMQAKQQLSKPRHLRPPDDLESLSAAPMKKHRVLLQQELEPQLQLDKKSQPQPSLEQIELHRKQPLDLQSEQKLPAEASQPQMQPEVLQLPGLQVPQQQAKQQDAKPSLLRQRKKQLQQKQEQQQEQQQQQQQQPEVEEPQQLPVLSLSALPSAPSPERLPAPPPRLQLHEELHPESEQQPLQPEPLAPEELQLPQEIQVESVSEPSEPQPEPSEPQPELSESQPSAPPPVEQKSPQQKQAQARQKRAQKKQAQPASQECQVVPSDGPRNFPQEALCIFAHFEETAGSDAAGALARLRALRRSCKLLEGCEDNFNSALTKCAEAVLRSGECRSAASLVDACLDLLVAAAAEAEAEDGCPGRLLSWIVLQMGASDGTAALRERAARCRGAELLWKLLSGQTCLASATSSVDDQSQIAAKAGKVLLSLSKDRAPAVRLAATRGLGLLKGEDFKAALLLLACKDPTPGVRAAALVGLGAHGAAVDAQSRSLDISSQVRLRLFEALTSSFKDQTEAQELPFDLIRSGLRDRSYQVRVACEECVCAWVSNRSSSSPEPLVDLMEQFLSAGGADREEVAEATLHALLSKQEWAVAGGAQEQSAQATELRSFAASLVWRVGRDRCSPHLEQAPVAAILPLAEQALRALREGRGGELRQLLKALLASEGSTSELLQVAKATLLEADLDDELLSGGATQSSVAGLAVAMIRRALGGGGQQGPASLMVVEVEVNKAIASVLEEIWEGGLESLSRRFDRLLSKQASIGELAAVADTLSGKSSRALNIIEQTLCQSSANAGGSDFGNAAPLVGDLLEKWLCPLLTRADAAEPVLGGTSWAVQRALAVRCMALSTSMDPEAAASHWPFFVSVLGRYGPIAASLEPGNKALKAAEVITETCVLFLSDTLLLHGGPSGWLPNIAQHAKELFSSLLGVLGPPSISSGGRQQASKAHSRPRPALCRRLSERLITLMLYGTAWAGQEIVMNPSDKDLRPHAAASWALAWLLLEAFHRPPPGPSAAAFVEPGKMDCEAAAAAAHRGRLLCFFGCLGRASAPHAVLLASAGEILLSTELWRLGAAKALLGGKAAVSAASAAGLRRWRHLQLPRLVRLLCQQLAASCTAGKASAGLSQRMANTWLQCVWRPVALLCVENVDDEALLAELLIAALGPVEAVGGAAPLSVAAEAWPGIAREVREASQQIAMAWRKRKSLDTAAPAAEGSSGGVMAVARRAAERLRGLPRGADPEVSDGESSQSWVEASKLARERRLILRKVLKEDLQVDTKRLLGSATEAFKAHESRVSFLPERKQLKRPRLRKADDEGAQPRQAPQRAGSRTAPGISRKRRGHRAGAASDDDSEEVGRRGPSKTLFLGRPGGG